MRIVIIEDEKLLANDLSKIILNILPSAAIVQYITTVAEGIDFFQRNLSVDLIFSDIQLGDGLSFEIFEKVQNKIPIIFCTAFNQYALDAFNNLGIDYVLKPFSTSTIQKALDKYDTIKQNFTSPAPDYASLLLNLKTQLTTTKLPSVLIHQGDKIIPIDGESIALFYIEHTGVFAYTFDKRKLPVAKTLDVLETIYQPYFFRTNRQFLIHRKAIKEASQYFNRKLLVILNIPFTEQITVGKEKATIFLEWLASQ
jgi:two-component system, LytTR family, response regulator LytT